MSAIILSNVKLCVLIHNNPVILNSTQNGWIILQCPTVPGDRVFCQRRLLVLVTVGAVTDTHVAGVAELPDLTTSRQHGQRGRQQRRQQQQQRQHGRTADGDRVGF